MTWTLIPIGTIAFLHIFHDNYGLRMRQPTAVRSLKKARYKKQLKKHQKKLVTYLFKLLVQPAKGLTWRGDNQVMFDCSYWLKWAAIS